MHFGRKSPIFDIFGYFCAICDQNAWTIAQQSDEKRAIFDQNVWTIAQQNDEK